MHVSALCPYLDSAYANSIDELLGTLPEPQRADKLQQLVYHLEKNPAVTGLHSPEELFGMNDAALAPFVNAELDARRSHEMDRYSDLVQMSFLAEEDGGGASTMRCSKCQGTDIDWSVQQTRGADEGSTVFCVCKNKECRARWRM